MGLRNAFDIAFSGHVSASMSNNVIKADLHCHDHNSDRADEKCGRILNVAETWLPTERLLRILKENGCNALTVTNHNNARSCYELQDKGIDVLTGAEFDCTMPEERAIFHVLAYGFTPNEEKRLFLLRKNIYRFAEYAFERNIPTTLAHPLFFREGKNRISDEALDNLLLIFERFEVLNGQRDSHQNLMVNKWLLSVTPEKIETIAARTGIDPSRFSQNPFVKKRCGGSDDHMGIFAGTTGSYIVLSEDDDRYKTMSGSEKLLHGIRYGEIKPYGRYQDLGKLSISLFDYFCQGVANYKDPGLFRILLHKGELKEKAGSLLISNAVGELRRHKHTTKFLHYFHEALHGVRIPFFDRIMCPSSYKPLLSVIDSMAISRQQNPSQMDTVADEAITEIHDLLCKKVVKLFSSEIQNADNKELSAKSIAMIVKKLEISSQFRLLFNSNGSIEQQDISDFNIGKVLDRASFPLLALLVVNATRLLGSRVQMQNRVFLDRFAEINGLPKQPQRLLWLTDTFGDTNGVSVSLRHALLEIQKHDYPVDILICSETVKEEPHLIVLKPLAEFNIPGYSSATTI